MNISHRFRDFDTECDAGQCCSIPDQQTLYWETCENGGYFISSNCQQDADCAGNVRANSRWANENQICLNYECCTVPIPGDTNDLDPNYGNLDNHDPNWNYQCANGGYYLDSVCQRDADCNRIPSLRLQRTEQIACLDGYCCIMVGRKDHVYLQIVMLIKPRRLPPGARDWTDVCPSGGNYLGTFCDADRDCGAADVRTGMGRICDQKRYCCTDPRELGTGSIVQPPSMVTGGGKSF